MPAYQLNKILYIKSQKVIKGPLIKTNSNRYNTISRNY